MKTGTAADMREVPGGSAPTRETGDRIARLQSRYQTDRAMISVQRARYYTESWTATEGSGLSQSVRVALAMKNVYEKMDHYLDPDDRIAGYWTEQFLGIPIDIERGVFNEVFRSELTKKSMLLFRGRSMAKGLTYMLRKGMLGEFLKNQKTARAGGTPPLNMEMKTMSQREINPFHIADHDRRELLTKLLPRWKGKTLVDRQEKVLAESGLYSQDMHDFVVAIPGNTSRQVMMLSTCATIATIQGHVILEYDRVLEKGLLAMREEIREAMQQGDGEGEEADFLRSLEIALEGVMIYSTRLAEKIQEEIARGPDPRRRATLEEMLARCRQVPLLPARSFEEAVQCLWTVKTAVELAHPVNLHCFGRLYQSVHDGFCHDRICGQIQQKLGPAPQILPGLKNMAPETTDQCSVVSLSDLFNRLLQLLQWHVIPWGSIHRFECLRIPIDVLWILYLL